MGVKELFSGQLEVINVGLSSFDESIRKTGGSSLQVEWSPPGEADRGAAQKLAELTGSERVIRANEAAYSRFLQAQPKLLDLDEARSLLEGFGDKTVLHAGPPVEWEEMCGPMKGAIVGAILFEGWAESAEKAKIVAASGEISFAPCHHYRAVGPMSGVISPSMDLWVVENSNGGNRAFSNLNEGLGKVLRFGANGEEVIERLRWMKRVLAPTIRRSLRDGENIELKPLMAQALHMGDEVHNRNSAASSLFLKRLVPQLLRSGMSKTSNDETSANRQALADIVDFIAGNDHFFLNISMAACKSMLDAAHGVDGSSMVTAMSRNGREFGIRVSGTGNEWFTAPAPMVEGLYFPGYTHEDGAPDLGDSAITETAGLGGFSMATAPAIVQFVGGTPEMAKAYTEEMGLITLGRNSSFTLPPLDFAGSPAGIDVLRVVDSGIRPIINTGIAHKEAGVGQIGAGITRAPMRCFTNALVALRDRLAGNAGPTLARPGGDMNA